MLAEYVRSGERSGNPEVAVALWCHVRSRDCHLGIGFCVRDDMERNEEISDAEPQRMPLT